MIQHKTLIAILLSTLFLTIAPTSRGAEDADTALVRAMFARINLDYPGLEKVKAALARDDLPAAEAAYLQFWRERDDRKVLWNPIFRAFPLEQRTGAASDFFHDPPVTVSWRDREKLKTNLYTGKAWANYADEPTQWTLSSMADLMLENRLVRLRLGNQPPVELGEPWNLDAGGDFAYRQYFAPVLSQAYWLTGDDRYVRKLMQAWTAWIGRVGADCSRSPGNNSFLQSFHGCMIPGALEMVLDSPALYPAEFCLVVAYLSDGSIGQLTGAARGGNQTLTQANAILSITSALPEFKDSPQWAARGRAYLTDFCQQLTYPDGGFAETTFLYSLTCAGELLAIKESLEANGLSVPEQLTGRAEKWGDYFMNNAQPDSYLPWTGHGAKVEAAWLLGRLARMYPHRKDFLYYATRGQEGEQPKNPSRWFNWSGYCSMRDRYDTTANYLFFDVGPCGSFHKNANKLQIVVASHGRTLLEDRGIHTYSPDKPEFRTYFDYCYGHSTVIVDGKSQPIREEVSTAPLTNPWMSTAVLDYNAGEYSGGYHPTSYVAGEVDNGVRHHRSVVFVKPDYWIVTDRLLPTGKDDPDRERTFEQLFQYIPGEITEHRDSLAVSSATPGEPNLALIPVSREGLELEIACGRREPYILGWAVSKNKEELVEPAPTVIYRKRAASPAVMQTVLWPMKAGQTQHPQVERIGEPGDGAVKVTLPDGRVDWYRSSAAPSAMEVGGVSYPDALAALVRLDSKGQVVAREAVKQ